MKLKTAQNAYFHLLRVPINERGRVFAQRALAALRDEIAEQEHRESESVQNEYEKLAREWDVP